MRYKVAIVGCGARASAHIDAYEYLDDAEVTACYAPSATRRDPLAEEYGIKAYDSLEDMLTKERPDLVHVITPPSARVGLMTTISDFGVPLCTVEKPIACGEEDWDALCRLEAGSSTKFAVCHQVRWQEHLQRCREAALSGRLGRPLFLDISSGMNIAGQGTHTLNYGRAVIGDPRVVRVSGRTYGWDDEDTMHPAPKSSECLLEFDNGVRGVWCSGDLSPRCGDPDTTWQHVRIVAFFEKGRVRFEEFGVWEIVSPDGVETGDFGEMDAWNEKNIRAQAAFHRSMFDWLENDESIPGTNLKDSLHEWNVVLSLYRSSEEGRALHL